MENQSSSPDRVPPPRRPALLIGQGDFGRTVLERFLTSAALRGALRWTEPGGGASPSERYLQDLAVIHLANPLRVDSDSPDDDAAGEPRRLEALRDLVAQIRTVPAGTDQLDQLAEVADTAVHKLLAAREGERPLGSLGLDVFVIAQPGEAKALGSLSRLLPPLMARLANHPFLVRNRRLNFIAIFDFENYWDDSLEGHRLRRVMRSSVERWCRDRAEGRQAFGRIYLVDGRSENGVNGEPRRIEEINLFLELLLFEGQRGELQQLFQTQRLDESPVYTFGVRALERQAGLLAHRAAAEFGESWLHYLAGTEGGRSDNEPIELRKRLERYRAEELEALFGAADLRRLLEDRLSRLESELIKTLEQGDDRWLETVRSRYEEVERTLWTELTSEAALRMETISRERLDELDRDLREGVDTDLHHERHPVPLGTVLQEVEDSLRSLERARTDQAPPLAATPSHAFGRLEALSRRYRRFRERRLRTSGLHVWWLLLSAVIAGTLTPLVEELLKDVPQPGPLAHRGLSGLWKALQHLADPVVLSLLLFAGSWLIGGRLLQRRFERKLDRAALCFTDPRQGRFVDRLREAFGPGGAFQAPLARRLELLIEDMTLAVRSAVRRELGRVRDRLRQRQIEMSWLSGQLKEFRRVYGSADNPTAQSNGRGIRVAAETPEDYRRMLASNPAETPRFQSAQASRQPFATWNETWCDAFLHPFHFIQDLSALYSDPFEQELSQPEEGESQRRWARTFIDFVEQHGSSPTSFHWHQLDVVPPEQRFCLLPPLWQRLGSVRQTLIDHRIDDEHILDGRDVGRSYLVKIQGGVDPSHLGET